MMLILLLCCTGVPDVVVRVASEMPGADNVTVQLVYNEEPNVAYSLIVLDMTTMTSTSINGLHNSSIPLILSYNTEYRVTSWLLAVDSCQ